MTSCYKQQTSASEKQGVTVRKCGAPGRDDYDDNDYEGLYRCVPKTLLISIVCRKNGDRLPRVVNQPQVSRHRCPILGQSTFLLSSIFLSRKPFSCPQVCHCETDGCNDSSKQLPSIRIVTSCLMFALSISFQIYLH